MIKELHGAYELLPYMSVSIQNKYIYSILEVVFWLSSAYEHIMKKYPKTKIENVNNNMCVHPSIIYLLTSFRGEKTTFYVVCAKKTTKNYHVNSHIEASKFDIFTQT
jgi:hypothetical protein